MQTSQRQISMFTETKSTSLQADSLVSRTARQASEKGKTMIVTSGPTCYELFEKSVLAGWWAKMFSGLLLGTGAWYSKRCALSWKLKVTPYSRLLFQLAPSALPTEEIEYGLLRTPSAQEPGIKNTRLVTKNGEPAEIGKRAYDKHTGRLAQVGLTQQVQMMRLLPTPKASDLERGNRKLDANGQNINSKGVRVGVPLPQLAKSGLLPTPTTQETPHYEAELTETGRRVASNGNSHSLNLADHAIRGLLPTPTCMDATNATATMKSTQVKEGSMHSVTLNRAMSMGILPTPKVQDSRHALHDRGKSNLGEEISQWGQENGKGSQLNPLFVAEMMGFPPNWTVSPFQNGEEKVSRVTETQ